MTRNIDELSNLTTRAVEPEKYFGEMDLNEEQVKKRVAYTKKANELFDVILILLMTMRDSGTLDYVYARDMLESWLLSLISEFTTPDDYLIDYATDTAYNFVDTTKKHIDEPWYTSSDRSLFNAENSANDVMNYSEYIDALHSGKTEKRWITEPDNRVRKTHKEVTKKPIPIKDLFRVGFALMRFPKDYDLAAAFPEELINCRCSIEYLPKDDESAIKKNINTSWSNKIINHSQDEIEELKEYGRNKGIIVTNSFDYFDGDLSLIKEYVDKLSENVNKYKPHNLKNDVYLEVSYTMSDKDYAATKNATVTLNGFAYRDRKLLKEDYATNEASGHFTKGSSYMDIATHEAAHVLNYLNQLKIKKIVERVFGYDYDAAIDVIIKNISEYATYSPKELLAESYVAYTNGSKNEFVLKVMKYCGII